MHSKFVIGQAEVARVLTAARQEALAQQWNVTIAVVDDGGHPLALERMDGCAPASAYIAVEKARTSALGRKETRDYEQMVNGGRTAFVTAPLLTAGVPIDLPDSRANALPQEQAQIAISIGADGTVFIGEEAVPPEALPQALADLKAGAGTGEAPDITLRADRALDYGRVMGVMGELNRAGLNRISLVTNGGSPVNEGS